MIVIVDYGMGNLGSMVNMLKKVGTQVMVSSDPAIIAKADKLILPGVGAFDTGMRNLEERGLIPILDRLVLKNKVPILGVCVGMQLLGKRSEEGHLPGLGWIDAEIVRFKFDHDNINLKVPLMGWNRLDICHPHSLFSNLESENRFYFVHSYHVLCNDPAHVLAQTTYGIHFTSVVGKENILGIQFHPEKSHRFGLRLLQNFAERV